MLVHRTPMGPMVLSEKKYCYVPGVDPRSCATSTYKEFGPYGAREEKTKVVPRDVFDPFRYRFGLVWFGGSWWYGSVFVLKIIFGTGKLNSIDG